MARNRTRDESKRIVSADTLARAERWLRVAVEYVPDEVRDAVARAASKVGDELVLAERPEPRDKCPDLIDRMRRADHAPVRRTVTGVRGKTQISATYVPAEDLVRYPDGGWIDGEVMRDDLLRAGHLTAALGMSTSSDLLMSLERALHCERVWRAEHAAAEVKS